MIERRLPPALEEKVLPRTGWPAVPESDLLDWLYGIESPSGWSSGLVERVRERALDISKNEGDVDRWVGLDDFVRALRAELGEP